MAHRIEGYEVRPPKIGPDARQELDRLLQTLHRHGVLRLANDLVGANAGLAQVVVDGLNQPGSLNALQNLGVLVMALSQIEPADFYRVIFALKSGFDGMAAHRPSEEGESGDAPGISGAYRMLHDEALWRAIVPAIAGLKGFAAALERPVDKPISEVTGKPSAA